MTPAELVALLAGVEQAIGSAAATVQGLMVEVERLTRENIELIGENEALHRSIAQLKDPV